MGSLITREVFVEATGREPQDDDLDRCNCEQEGRIGHLCCGWDYHENKPQFETMKRLSFMLEDIRTYARGGS